MRRDVDTKNAYGKWIHKKLTDVWPWISFAYDVKRDGVLAQLTMNAHDGHPTASLTRGASGSKAADADLPAWCTNQMFTARQSRTLDDGVQQTLTTQIMCDAHGTFAFTETRHEYDAFDGDSGTWQRRATGMWHYDNASSMLCLDGRESSQSVHYKHALDSDDDATDAAPPPSSTPFTMHLPRSELVTMQRKSIV